MEVKKMPRGDGTGPRGQGAGTGRGMGRGQGGAGQGQGSGGRGLGGGTGAGPGGYCVCPNCGQKEAHQLGIACFDQKCPKCGTTMTRE